MYWAITIVHEGSEASYLISKGLFSSLDKRSFSAYYTPKSSKWYVSVTFYSSSSYKGGLFTSLRFSSLGIITDSFFFFYDVISSRVGEFDAFDGPIVDILFSCIGVSRSPIRNLGSSSYSYSRLSLDLLGRGDTGRLINFLSALIHKLFLSCFWGEADLLVVFFFGERK